MHHHRLFNTASSFSPGLQRAFGGHEIPDTVGGSGSSCAAKRIEVNRLRFRSKPQFNPMPFLDQRSQRIYDTPIDVALQPDEIWVDPPKVRIHAAPDQRQALFRALDATGRLGLIGESEVVRGFQAGVFSITKDLHTDRLIFDSRPFNLLETAPKRWVHSTATAANLCDLQLPEDCILVASGTDLREFYYSFIAGKQRTIRNTLACALSPREARQYTAYHSGLASEQKIYPALMTLGMGDTCAVELAQTAHISMLIQSDAVSEDELLALHLPCPRSLSMTGVVIDDLVALEILSRQTFEAGFEAKSARKVRTMLKNYVDAGLEPHEGKTFYQEPVSTFWGAAVDGVRGQVRASLNRVLPITFVTSLVLKIGVVSLALLEVLVGCWTSTFLFRRRLLSLFSVVYEPLQRGLRRSTVIRLSPELAEELLLIMCLAPLAVTDIKARNSSYIYSSDASSDFGIGVTRARLPAGLEAEVHRHKLHRPVWTKLLTPLRKLQRMLLDQELPDGQRLPSHPLWLALGGGLVYEEVLRQRVVKHTHINILELRGLTKTEQIASSTGMRQRVFQLADSQVALGCWIKGRASSTALNQELQRSLAIHCGCNMQSNAGFLPTEYNSADGPSRGRDPDPPSLELPSCFASLPALAEFDSWLARAGADPYTLSGLPSFDELKAEPGFKCKPSTGRRKLQRLQLASGVISQASARDDAQIKHMSSCASPEVGDRSELLDHPSTFVETGAVLCAEAVELLKAFPVEQFVLPSWASNRADWRPSRVGYLDLYSGKKGVARELAELTGGWILSFEILDDPAQDLSSPHLRRLLGRLVALHAFDGVGVAIFCASFSRAVTPPRRSAAEPYGVEGLTGTALESVLTGNDHAEFALRILKLCIDTGIWYWCENPHTSFLWWLPGFAELGARERANRFLVDYCTLGAPWRKRTAIITNTHLKGFSVLCARRHKHKVLRGFSKQNKCCWTRVAQEYPKQLCMWIAYALAYDSGRVSGTRPITVAAMAKCCHGRIGEAKNPGPRGRRDFGYRAGIDLDQVPLVEAATSKLGVKVYVLFVQWLHAYLSADACEGLLACPATLAELARFFGTVLFDQRHSLYMYRQLLTHLLREVPSVRQYLGGAWQLVTKWSRLEPVEHRLPVPVVLLRALASLALSWNWPRWTAMTLMIFFGIARPGDVLRAKRSELLLPEDLVAEAADSLYIKILGPKTRHRGLGLVQHTKVTDPLVTSFCSKVLGRLPSASPLYPGNPASFRKRWDALLHALEIPDSLRLTPAGLRAGGAVWAYRQNTELQRILWQMRLSNLTTLQHYVQEVGADSVFVQLPPRSRSLLKTASSCYEAFVQTFSCDGSPGP